LATTGFGRQIFGERFEVVDTTKILKNLDSRVGKRRRGFFKFNEKFEDRKKRKKKKNLLSFQGPSPLVCPIF
jgi:hypothetical protein